MFFSAYVHNVYSFDHLLGNYAGYVIVMVLILLILFMIIPLLKVNKKLSLNYSDQSLFITSAIFFFLLPFAVAGISIEFGKMMNQQGTWGFSGILWAFSAYFFFLLIRMVYDVVLTKSLETTNQENMSLGHTDGSKPRTSDLMNTGSFLVILISVFLIIAPIIVILLDIGNEKINVVAHLGGFILGLLISIIVALICESNQKRVISFFTFFLALIIIIPAISWHFL